MQQHPFSTSEIVTPQLIAEVAGYSSSLANARRMLELLDPPFRDARQLATDILSEAGEAASAYGVNEFNDGPHHWFALEELLTQNKAILSRKVLSIADCGVLYANYLAIIDRDLSKLSTDVLREITLPLVQGVALPFRIWLFDQLTDLPQFYGFELSDFDTDLVENEEADREIVLIHLAALERIGVVTDEVWGTFDSVRAFELQYRLEALERSRTVLTPEQGEMVYLHIRGHLDGLGRVPLYIVDRIPGFPFSWILWDDDDEIEGVLVIEENKREAFGSGDISLPIKPLPTYPISGDPVRWLTEALTVDFSDRRVQKVLLYALDAGVWSSRTHPKALALLPSIKKLIETFDVDGSEVMREKKNELFEEIDEILA